MLWEAGQERLTREGRDRLAEMFVAARDAAMDVLVNSGQAKPKGAWRLPSYLGGERPKQPTGSPAQRDAMLAQLNMMVPGMVRRGDS